MSSTPNCSPRNIEFILFYFVFKIWFSFRRRFRVHGSEYKKNISTNTRKQTKTTTLATTTKTKRSLHTLYSFISDTSDDSYSQSSVQAQCTVSMATIIRCRLFVSILTHNVSVYVIYAIAARSCACILRSTV